jgi:hypothetical protein
MSNAMNNDATFWETLLGGMFGGGGLLTILQWVFGAGSLKQQIKDLAARLEEHEAVQENIVRESIEDRKALWKQVNLALTKDDLQGINDTLNRIQNRIDYLISGRMPPIG